MTNNPDTQALAFNRGIGEFSIRSEEAFERHIKLLVRKSKNQLGYENHWYNFTTFMQQKHDDLVAKIVKVAH